MIIVYIYYIICFVISGMLFCGLVNMIIMVIIMTYVFIYSIVFVLTCKLTGFIVKKYFIQC